MKNQSENEHRLLLNMQTWSSLRSTDQTVAELRRLAEQATPDWSLAEHITFLVLVKGFDRETANAVAKNELLKRRETIELPFQRGSIFQKLSPFVTVGVVENFTHEFEPFFDGMTLEEWDKTEKLIQIIIDLLLQLKTHDQDTAANSAHQFINTLTTTLKHYSDMQKQKEFLSKLKTTKIALKIKLKNTELSNSGAASV